METLQEAKEYLRENFTEGTGCPCCGQFVKLYKRKISSTASRMLIKLNSFGVGENDGYHHVGELAKGICPTGSGDFSKLSYWRLVEEKENIDGDKRNSGIWRITPRGVLFVENKLKIPSHVYIFNRKKMFSVGNRGFSEKTISIVDTLGKKFSYKELMNYDK